MSDTNDQSSDTGSDLNYNIDYPIEGEQHDPVVFENVADQYVKGEDVTAFFTVLQEVKVDLDQDKIGLLRIGYTNIKECLTYASVQFNPSTTSGSVRHGIATFPSTSLPVTDDEFYQFCYIHKTKNLGSSIPFQLNCASDDIDLLSNTPISKTKADGLIALADQDNDELVVIHTKRMLTDDKLRQQNQQLIDMNRRLESQKDQCQAELDSFEAKRTEQVNKLNNDMQTLIASHKAAVDELASRQQAETKLRIEYDACRSLCDQYQAESSQYADRCRTLEVAQSQFVNDTNQLRSQSAVTSQLIKDQATQVIDLERRLMQANELTKTANQRQAQLEQQIRDLRLTSEKYQISMQGQLEEYSKQVAQRVDQINALETANGLLKEELNSSRADNERLTLVSTQDKALAQEFQQQLEELREQHRVENEKSRNQIDTLRGALDEKDSTDQAYLTLKTSYTQIEKRCVKHQKTEIEVKRQLSVYQSFIEDLQREIQDLTERLAAGADEYKTLFRKYNILERSLEMNQQQEQVDTTPKPTTTDDSIENEEQLVSVLRNTYANQENNTSSIRPSLINSDGEVRQCPMCSWEFPKNLTFDQKNEHIESHFQ